MWGTWTSIAGLPAASWALNVYSDTARQSSDACHPVHTARHITQRRN